jgi:PAS domain S-box-containing protein
MLEELRAIFDNTEQAVILLDDHYNVLVCNKKCQIYAKEAFGNEIEKGKNILDLLSANERESIANDFVMTDVCSSFSYDKQIKLQSGSSRWFRVNYSKIKGTVNPQVNYFVGFFEITQEKDFQERLFNKTAEMEAILSCVPYHLFKVDRNGIFKGFFGGPKEQLFIPAEDFIGKSVLDVMPREIGEVNMAAIQECLRTQKINSFQYSIPVKGVLRHYMAKMASLNENEVLVSSQDITFEREAEEKIKQSEENYKALFEETNEQKEKIVEQNIVLRSLSDRFARKITQLEEFSYIVTHNMRSPINNLQGLLTMMDRIDNVQEKERIQGLVRNSVMLLSDTLNELSNVLRMRQNPEVDRRLLNFEEVFTKIINQQDVAIKELNTDIQFDFQKAPTVLFPSIYLESIFLNLLSNSLKYHSPNRRLQISVRTHLGPSKEVILTFSDNGLGIDMELHGNKVFKLYKTFHRNTDSRGLGLFLTKNQMESQGGSILLESQVEVGTTFTLVFSSEEVENPKAQLNSTRE